MELIEYFKQHTKLSAELEATLDRAFQEETVPKGYRVVEPNTSSKKLFFIEKGLARSFYYKETKDITHNFFSENGFYTSIESVFYQTPSPYGFEFLEKSTIRVVSYPEIERVLSQSSELEQFIRQLLIDLLKTLSDRLYSIQFQSAQERYQSMIEGYPDILLRAPLGHVASYLGITQQTLSVIRAQK